MRLAVLADIHGNSIALDAVLEDIRSLGGVDAYWVLGDLVAIGHDPVGVLERLQSLPNATFTGGNTDRYVTAGIRPYPSIDRAATSPALVTKLLESEGTFSWAHGAVAAAGYFEWLAGLPLDVRTVTEDGTRILGVHASPGREDGEGLYPKQPEQAVRAACEGCDADIVLVGHTHRVVDRTVGGVRVINPGSVSNHFGPDVTAKWVLVESEPAACGVTFRQVPYDNDAVIDALERVRHPGRTYIARFMRGQMTPPNLPTE